jgi:ABC-2 type transport system permease protein
MKPFSYLVRRELWENRWVWRAPVALTGVLLLAYVAAIVLAHVGITHIQIENNQGSFNIESGAAYLSAHPRMADKASMVFFSLLTALFNLVLIITMARYLLHSLYGDRKDRSILFWRSLPISDTATVLSKLLIVMVGAPLATFVMLVIAQLLGIGAAAAGGVFNFTWSAGDMLHLWAFLFVGFFVQSLWYLPFYGWIMMASAWARQAPVLWTVLPPLLAGIIELILFQTDYFFSTIGNHAASILPAISHDGAIAHPGDLGLGIFSLRRFADVLSSGELWIGAAIGIVFVAAAIFIRRYRGEDY